VTRRTNGLSQAEEDLSRLIGEIYRATLEPEGWTPVLEKVADFVNGSYGMVLVRNKATALPFINSSARLDPEVFIPYYAHYCNLDLWIKRGIDKLPAGTTARGVDLVPFDELRETEFYNDFIDPNECSRMMVGVTAATDSVFGHVSIFRRNESGEFEDSDIARFRAIMPHLQQASQIALKLGGNTAKQMGFEPVLDAMADGVLLLDDKGEIVHINAAAQRILESKDGLHLSRSGLRASKNDQTAKLRTLVAAAIAARDQPISGGGGSLRIARPSGKRAYMVLIGPIAAVEVAWSLGRPAVVVFITDPERQAAPPFDLLRRGFGLTPAEARLTVALIQEPDLKTAAERLAITEGTARIYLKQVFEKTGVNSQVALMKLLLTGPAILGK